MTALLPIKELHVDVVEPNARRRKGTVACRLDHNINFDLEALASFSSHKWHLTVYDALVVAAAVEFCDRSLVRSTMTWGRRFLVYIPVHEPYKWSDSSVKQALIAALNLLTGDDWNFEFRPRKISAASSPQDRMPFPPDVEAVIAFSDGMDSRAVAGLESKRLGHRLIRVRVGSKQQDVSRKERLKVPFTALPYAVNVLNKKNNERSARSRGFKFSLVSAMAAFLIDAPYVVVPESGQGALGPALLPVGHGYEDYRNHPLFTALMERFVRALLEYKVQYQFPRLWMTKGETLQEFFASCEGASLWSSTRSCWQQSRQVSVGGVRRQCGICAACMLRRLSVHAAGLQESADSYVWESLHATKWEAGAAKQFTRFTKALREYSIAGVLHFDHLSTIRESVQYKLIKRTKIGALASSLAQQPQDISRNLDRLLEQHAKEWSAFTNDLGPRSFVRKWIDDAS